MKEGIHPKYQEVIASCVCGNKVEMGSTKPQIRVEICSNCHLASATANIGVAVADYFPRFSLTGTFGVEGSQVKQLGDFRNRYFTIGPTMSWPILDFGRVASNVEVQNALQQQTLYTYRSTVLTSLKEVDDALVAYVKEQDRRLSRSKRGRKSMSMEERKIVSERMRNYWASRRGEHISKNGTSPSEASADHTVRGAASSS